MHFWFCRYLWFLSYCIFVIFDFSAGTNADIMKVGGYKLSALDIEAVLLEASAPSFHLLNANKSSVWDNNRQFVPDSSWIFKWSSSGAMSELVFSLDEIESSVSFGCDSFTCKYFTKIYQPPTDNSVSLLQELSSHWSKQIYLYEGDLNHDASISLFSMKIFWKFVFWACLTRITVRSFVPLSCHKNMQRKEQKKSWNLLWPWRNFRVGQRRDWLLTRFFTSY